MKFTAQEEYGLRCLLQVARRDEAGPVSIRTVAEAEALGNDYAAKLLRLLRQAELLTSTRGASGGYRLARPASEITVWSVLQVLDSPLWSEAFCTGHTGQKDSCIHDGTGCSIRVLWQWVDASLRRSLERVTLADLLGGSTVRTVLDAVPAAEAR